VLQIKVGQEVDGKIVDKITINEDTEDMTFWFGKECLVKKSNESIAEILDYKWGEEDADKTKT
tara:strand:+ start:355 stop:543 length:189 start_codon:yes stop_codon:yes gene_type:complete